MRFQKCETAFKFLAALTWFPGQWHPTTSCPAGLGATDLRMQVRDSWFLCSRLYQFPEVLTDSRVRNSRQDNRRLVGQASRLSRNDGQDARPTKSSAISVITFENRYRSRIGIRSLEGNCGENLLIKTLPPCSFCNSTLLLDNKTGS